MNTPRFGPIVRQALTTRGLRAAWEKVADNQGMAGIDGETIGDVAKDLGNILKALAQSVVAGHYQPKPLKRVWVPRPGKTPRGLAVPTVRDRILQTSIALAMTPKVERELEDCSFAYRQGRGVRQAVDRINYFQRQGYRWVVDADIESFFDNIPHAALLTRLEKLVPEAALIELTAQWLTAEIADRGQLIRPTRGIPQGSPISPLLANLYLDTLDEALLDANHVIVRYADDFVVLTKQRDSAESALELTREVLERLSLRLNPIKTRIVHLDQGLEFLGWHFVRSLCLPRSWHAEDSSNAPPPELAESTPNAMTLAMQEAELAQEEVAADSKSLPDEPEAESLQHDEDPADLDVEESETDDLPTLAPLQRTLYLVDREAALTVENQRYVVRRNDQPVLSLPAVNVDQIMVFGSISVSNAALQLAARHHCNLAFLSRFGRCYGRFEPAGINGLPLLSTQIKSHENAAFGVGIARQLIAAKLSASALILKRVARHNLRRDELAPAIQRLRELERALKTRSTVEQLRGTEGGAAAIYWKAFALLLPAPWGMPHRQSHPAPDPVNALLSLGYSILYNAVAGLLIARGLQAGLGYLHVSGGDHHALASDLMEPYRAYVVDATVLHLIHSGQLDPGDSRQQSGRCLLGADTTRTFIRALEGRFNRVQKHPQDGEATDLRRIIDRDVLRLISALRENDAASFVPTRWR